METVEKLKKQLIYQKIQVTRLKNVIKELKNQDKPMYKEECLRLRELCKKYIRERDYYKKLYAEEKRKRK